jgi:alpha-2-macroglobulin
MERGIGAVDVTVETQGPVEVAGERTQRVSFTAEGEQDVHFTLRAKNAVGAASVKVAATGSGHASKSAVDIAVRSSSPRIQETETREINPGGSVSMTVPAKGLEGTNRATLTVWRRQPIRLGPRLQWLLEYPYGCIEQTVSAVFPQLYLKDVLDEGVVNPAEIDRNINAGIARLSDFQLPSGAFAYWPGGREPSVWATDYAGRFLVEARTLGYSVPVDLFKRWLTFEKKQAHAFREGVFVQCHRLFLLAEAGEPQIGAMNIVREDSLRVMNDASKWLLAAAYKLAGVDNAAQAVLSTAGTRVEPQRRCHYWWTTYGDPSRDQALILEQAVLFERWTEANRMVDDFARMLGTNDWYSTQTLGTILLALGKYFKSNTGEEPPVMAGVVRLPDGTREKFKTGKNSVSFKIGSGFGKSAEVELDRSSTLKRVFCELDWSGVPPEPDMRTFSQNLSLSADWLDDDGAPVNPGRLKQGKAFWGRFKVSAVSGGIPRTIENLALVQVLPSGWEIENLRVTGEALPEWAADQGAGRFDYQDIRDDRVMWFFNLPSYADGQTVFLVKLNAVTAGEFTLPPALCEAMYDATVQSRAGGGRVTVEP